MVFLDLINYCHIRCQFCWEHSPLVGKSVRPLALSLQEIEKAFAGIKDSSVEYISLSGDGEPLLHSELESIVRLLRPKAKRLSLTTNAILLEEKSSLLGLVDSLSINCAGLRPDLYTKLHGVDLEVWQTFLGSLKLALLNKVRKGRPYIELVYIITRDNWAHIEEYLSLAEKMGIDEVEFRLVDTVKETESLHQFDPKAVIRVIDSALEKRKKIKHNLLEIRSVFEGEISAYHLTACYIPYFALFVNYDSTVRFCCHNESLILGSLHEGGLLSLWHSKKAEEMRRFFVEGFDQKCSPWKEECRYCFWAEENRSIKRYLTT